MFGTRPDPLKPADLRVDRSARPGWATGAEETPGVGRRVYCTAGMAEVVRVRGRVGNGSRLLELRLLDGVPAPFLVAASNVLVAPIPGVDEPVEVLPASPDWFQASPGMPGSGRR
jgi:hypothetical protein